MTLLRRFSPDSRERLVVCPEVGILLTDPVRPEERRSRQLP